MLNSGRKSLIYISVIPQFFNAWFPINKGGARPVWSNSTFATIKSEVPSDWKEYSIKKERILYSHTWFEDYLGNVV